MATQQADPLVTEDLHRSATIKITGASQPSTIHIAPGSFADLAQHLLAMKPSQIVAVFDANIVAHLEGRWLKAMNEAGLSGPIIHVAAGEASKSWAGLQSLVDACLEAEIDRQAVCVAIGGGVVGDLAGFAASIILRGIRLVQVPTTLLAMVDSSVGGKTAIDTPAGKNLVGSFYPANLVIIDPEMLLTLPQRHMRAGYAEMIKYGLICDSSWYKWCLKNGQALISSSLHGAAMDLAMHAITRCCTLKAEIVQRDEKEQNGDRALLNLGHTFAHAFEAALGYSDTLLHGEAVAIGLVAAAELSAGLGHIDAADVNMLRCHLQSCGLATEIRDVAPPPHGWTADDLIARMRTDKKGLAGQPRFVILKDMGRAELCHDNLLDRVYAQLETSC